MIKNIFIILLLSSAINSQSFNLVQHKSSITDTLGTEIIFYFSVINTSSTPLSFYVKRTENLIPEEWQSSLCFSSCFAPFVDSIVNNATFNSGPLAPGDTASVSVHIFTMLAHGQATVSLRFGNVDNPLETVNSTVFAATSPTNIFDNDHAADSYLLITNYPNPFNPETKVNFTIKEPGPVSLSVVSSDGTVSTIFDEEYRSAGNHTVNLNFGRLGLSSGIYFLKLQSGKFTSIRKVVFLK